jgi:cytochrome P450
MHTALVEHAWIALRDDDIEAALTASALLVRPPGRHVPAPMQGTVLGSIFARLARMNDGERHTQLRAVVERILSQWSERDLEAAARCVANDLAPRDIAAYAVATMIGIADPRRALVLIRDFSDAVAPGAPDEAIARGVAATPALLALLPDGDEDERANRLGLLFQASVATGKLIEALREEKRDPAVVLTRRWAADDTHVNGTRVARGEEVAVMLTSSRFAFGHGPHRCPGRAFAEAIARAAADATRGEDRSGS